MFLLAAVVGGMFAAMNTDGLDLADATYELGIGVGIAFVLAQFHSYLWGGYTAGRMGRGAGLANGLFVPTVAILVGLAIGGFAAWLGDPARLNLPFTTGRFPVERDFLVNLGTWVGAAALAAMFVGGAVGGVLGARWHDKLEAAEAETVERERIRT